MAVGAPDYQTNVRLVEQLKAILNLPHWYCELALDKTFYGSWLTPPGEFATLIEYEVPIGRRLYVSDATLGSAGRARWWIRKDAVSVGDIHTQAYGGLGMHLHRPLRFEGGDALTLEVYNPETFSVDESATLWGWEFPVGGGGKSSSIKTASQAFKTGLFNEVCFKGPSNGWREVEISGVDLKETYSFKVKNLYRPDEEVVDDVEVEIVKFPRRLV